ncbi:MULTISPECIES: alpha/beta hydrolase [unclassified Streptomyces]|uniref:alpha/beta hydrolase n=1 Tax=unclassified Streptomyces TaxID=2593676 RepID=UPI0022511CAD|nr:MULTISPECIES: alpha/beta hydrolase-fold protein [unclassified Streptomyces]WSP58876.1 esterase family protein [Streptomyces sp. NBC_01241]WSU20605.1 esterase family protein [Streptomyces sp. NBC_01108]MCX4790605.1 esterase family protein [Streptomyces sp. NBC_01221]MCX4793666.1 esterase family protein [Streptomyces sp. NBC_01242]WSJ35094.1 esterase family protein [Streptomyces sp. NBC_01321]
MTGAGTVRAAEVMELTGWPFLAVLCACSIALITVTMMLWNRWPARWALVLRLGCLLLLMITGAAVSADVVNREFGFYASFDDLLDRLPPVAVTHCPGGSDGATPGLVRGRIERVRLAGSDSGISREALVYLPATYASPVGVHRRFPVIELFHGYPGGPGNWQRRLGLTGVLDQEIAAGCMPPVIVVVPTDNDPGHDGECMDAVRGRRNETYLAVDVPTQISARYRVMAAPRSWATMGYSTGGFCAVNTAFHHPARYAAAASLSGYFTPVTDASTGDLYGGRPGVRQWNDPQWQAARHHADVPLYVVAGRADPEAQRAIEHLKAVARGHPPITTGESPAGGHNFSVWSKACPAAFEWLAAHLPPATPLLPPPHPGR